MQDSSSIIRLLMRIGFQWRWTKQRGRVWKQFLCRRSRWEVSRAKSHTHTHRVKNRCRAADGVLPWKRTCCWTWSGPHERTTKQNQTPTHQTDSHDRTGCKQGWVPSLCNDKKRGLSSGTQGKTATAPGLLQCCTSADFGAAAANCHSHHKAEPAVPGASLVVGQPQAPSMANTNHRSLWCMQKLPCDLGLRKKNPSCSLPFSIHRNVSSFSLDKKVILLQKVCRLPNGWAVLNKQLQGKIFSEMWVQHLRLTALFRNCAHQAMPPN